MGSREKWEGLLQGWVNGRNKVSLVGKSQAEEKDVVSKCRLINLENYL